ncbi:hypothetical protein PFISCL1PPCAC_9436, partial [Pristionchus fissidentatus]
AASSAIDQLAQVLLPSTIESLLSQLTATSVASLMQPQPAVAAASAATSSMTRCTDLLRALEALPATVSGQQLTSTLSPPIHAPTPIRPTPVLLSPHSYSSSAYGSCSSLHHPLSSLSSSPSALSPHLPPSCSSLSLASTGSSASSSSDPFSLRRSSAPEGPPQAAVGVEKRRFSDFTADRQQSTEFRRRHSMLASSSAIAERKSSNPRKQRTIYAGSQTRVLEEAFLSQRYMVGTEREALAARLGLSESQVRVWFQNRRSKHRKQSRTLSGSMDTTVTSPTVLPPSTVPHFSLASHSLSGGSMDTAGPTVTS